jgi:hypothetical protein
MARKQAKAPYILRLITEEFPGTSSPMQHHGLTDQQNQASKLQISS